MRKTSPEEELAQTQRELIEARELQAASAQVLRIISTSPKDVQPVFDAIAESAVRLCKGQFSFVLRFDNDALRFGASYGLTPEGLEAFRRELPRPADEGTASGRAILQRAIIQVPDVLADPAYGVLRFAQTVTYRSLVSVPMLRDGDPIGAITVGRAQAGTFSDALIGLLQTFADQAVIAIENVRLFEAEQQRTRELSEALEQQTASAEVLQAISSSSGHLEPVFQAILENATRICEAKFGTLTLLERNEFRVVAMHGVSPAFEELRRRDPRVPIAVQRRIETKRVVRIADLTAEESYASSPLVKLAGARSFVGVPMLKETELIGNLSIYRQEVRPFTDKQVDLLTNFAAQAVIAIENARLLNELRESLQQQTATADVLKVMSRSTFDLQAVLNALTETAVRLCDADMGSINREQGGTYRQIANFGHSPAVEKFMQDHPIELSRGTIVGRTVLERRPIQIANVQADPEYTFLEAAKLGGIHTMLGVPLMREGMPIGVFNLQRKSVRPYTTGQNQLVEG
jgi:two-component system, NtrC family, sensor kinase